MGIRLRLLKRRRDYPLLLNIRKMRIFAAVVETLSMAPACCELGGEHHVAPTSATALFSATECDNSGVNPVVVDGARSVASATTAVEAVAPPPLVPRATGYSRDPARSSS